jgi:DNA-binding MarR family transcriptional regulator
MPAAPALGEGSIVLCQNLAMRRRVAQAAAPDPSTATEAVEALLAASRAIVGIAVRSLAEVDPDVTLSQYRALAVLAARGPQRIADIASELGVAASTGTRMCDRLTRKGFARRARLVSDRRVVRLTLTPAGRLLVEQVTAGRRTRLAAIVAATTEVWHPSVAPALRAFAAGAGEIPEDEWWLGWPGAPGVEGAEPRTA